VDFTAFDRLIDERAEIWTKELREYCAIPSETGCLDHLHEAALWTSERLQRLGAKTDTLTLDGVPPLILGQIGEGIRRVICVQHYDVVPAAPLNLWTTPPFEPTIRDGNLFARGCADNKGIFLMRLHAVEAWLETLGELPCQVRFLVEGEEESGSRHLRELLTQRPDFLLADAALNETGYIDPQGRPLLTCGLRGLLYVDLSIRTLSGDTHSEMAMLLPNAAERMSLALASLKDSAGHIAIAKFYDQVVRPSAAQLTHLKTIVFEESALKRIHGAHEFAGGKKGFDAQLATMFEPTCNISGIWSGWNGAGVKTVIPAEAHAKLDMRLIPNQDPHQILQYLRRHFDAHGFADIQIKTLASVYPWWTPISHPLVQAAAGACEEMFESPPQRLVSSMSAAPMHQVCALHRLPAVGFGCNRPEDRSHAPNENISIETLTHGAKVFGRFLARFAEIPSSEMD
jgi:acetylornithine deacetylase/succinyl-diaminopimelate desuccinylase-like protein